MVYLASRLSFRNGIFYWEKDLDCPIGNKHNEHVFCDLPLGVARQMSPSKGVIWGLELRHSFSEYRCWSILWDFTTKNQPTKQTNKFAKTTRKTCFKLACHRKVRMKPGEKIISLCFSESRKPVTLKSTEPLTLWHAMIEN